MDIFRSNSDRIICSNHFQGTAFEKDEKNRENIKGSDSYNRFKRVEELVNRVDAVHVTDMSAILRDQRALGDSNVGMGNPLSINQLIAHHSVIFKPDSLIVWVSTSPWQLGKYVAYDLKKVFDISMNHICDHREIYEESRSIAADPFLASREYQQFMQFKKMTQELGSLKKTKKSLPEGFEQEYIKTNPGLYLTYSHLGDYYREIEEYEKAQMFYARALQKKLPGLDEKIKLEEISKELLKKINHGHPRN